MKLQISDWIKRKLLVKFKNGLFEFHLPLLNRDFQNAQTLRSALNFYRWYYDVLLVVIWRLNNFFTLFLSVDSLPYIFHDVGSCIITVTQNRRLREVVIILSKFELIGIGYQHSSPRGLRVQYFCNRQSGKPYSAWWVLIGCTIWNSQPMECFHLACSPVYTILVDYFLSCWRKKQSCRVNLLQIFIRSKSCLHSSSYRVIT